MDDWAVGDLALCIDDRPCPVFGPTPYVAGHTYIVAEVRTGACRQTGYRATCLRLVGVIGTPPWHNQSRFQKAPSHDPDAEDAETIYQLVYAPSPALVPEIGSLITCRSRRGVTLGPNLEALPGDAPFQPGNHGPREHVDAHRAAPSVLSHHGREVSDVQ
jgi:hypothetical protein